MLNLSGPNTNSKEATAVQQGVTANDDSTKNSSNQQTGLQPWLIAVVVFSCVAAVAACIAMIWAIRQLRKRKMVGDEKGSFDPGMFMKKTFQRSTEKKRYCRHSDCW